MMTKFKMSIKRSTYIIISLVLVLALVFPMAATAAQLELQQTSATGVIESFTAQFMSGAQLENGDYVWNVNNEAAGHRFKFKVSCTLSGEGYLQPGEIEIRVPKHILKDRSGNFADVYDLSEPMLAEAKDDSKFAYEEDGDDILITNHIELSSAIEASIEVSYSTSKSTFEYLDMGESDAFSAEINITASGNSATAQTEEISVYINTSAKLKSAQKQNATQHYRSWDSSWGVAPENASSYYYIVWPIISYIDESTTQPYNFVLEDTFNETDAEIVGYKMQGESTFTNKNYSNDLKTKGYRYDYVLTKHLISTYENQETYRLDNSVKATLTPADGLDSSDSISSSGYYNYSKPVYNPPGGRFISRKYGNSNWYNYFRSYWDIADYSLNDLKNGTKTCIDENLKYFEYIDGYAYPWTLADGASENDVEAYGQKKVKYELADEILYFESGISEENPRALTCDDYEVKKINYKWNIKDAEFNNDTKKFQTKAPIYTAEDDVLHFYAKFGNSDEWEQVGTYNLFTETAERESNYVASIDESQILFVEGSNCTAWKIVTENAYYYTGISAYPYYRLKNSSYIMQNIEGKNRVSLKNTSNAKVTQEDGTMIFSSDNWAVDYIVGVDPHSLLQKKVTNVTNNKSERYVSVGWQLDMRETYTTNAGVEYVKQDSGTFYDLLPAGASADETTVRIRTEDGVLADNFYEIDTQSNYKGTGRNLLKVTVDKQAKYYILTFTATYLWDNLKDYGKNLQNIAAYETGNDIISQGYPDNGGTLSDSSIMNDLDPQTSDEKFIYTQNNYEIDVLTSSFLGLTKMVKSSKDTKYSNDTNVNIDSEYIYRLRYSKDSGKAKNMILFDSLENYVTDDNAVSDWHGVLESVDISQPEKLGVAPVVYYSTIPNLDISTHHDLSETINGEKVWQTESEIVDISLAKAIAIDMSKDSDSDPFIFDGECSVAVPIYMRSPALDNTGKADPKAYNNVFISYTAVDELSNEEYKFFRYNYTTARLRVAADVGIYKADSTDIEKPVEGITFRLTGTSGYGTSVDISKKTGKNGKIKFSNIEKGTYTLFEDKGTDDYLRLENQMEVIIDGNGRVTIDGTEVAKGSYFTVLDEPRVHTDIQFYKKDLVRKNLGINHAKFKLWGASEYKNDVIMYATSDASGKVEFENIELGSYKLQEVEAPNGYIRNKNIYSVVVYENAVFSISGADSEYTTSGNYEIYNEPYHKFTIQKEGYTAGMPIRGAVFTLNGISKYGTSVNYEDDTDSSGKLTFSQLESGTYILQETFAPDGYALDATKRIVTIDKYGNITISGVETNSSGHFVIKNKENSVVTITKKWVDYSDNAHRPTPTITLSSKIPDLSATFLGANGTNSMLTRVTSASNVQSFSKGTDKNFIDWLKSHGEYEAWLNHPENKPECVTKMDDGNTKYLIYAWYDNTDDKGEVKWWSNAKTVYFPQDSNRLFRNLSSVNKIDLSGIDVSKVENMNNLFLNCQALTELILGSDFDTSNVTSMGGMFQNCSGLTELDISSFHTTNVTGMKSMFNGCSGLTELDLSSFDTSKVTNILYMFMNCSNLTTIYASNLWNTDAVTSSYSTDMFDGCTSLVGGEGTTFLVKNGTYARIDKKDTEGVPGYFTYKAAPVNSGSTPEPTTPDSTTTPEITYISTDSEHCAIEQVDADTWTYTFSGLDSNLQYYAWEDELEGYLSSNPIEEYLTIVDGKGTITNTTEDGTVTITKKWVDYSDNAHRPSPTITLSSNPPELSATFLEKNGSYSMLTRVTSASNIKEFSKCDEGEYEAWLEANGEYEAWLNHPENKPECVVQMDDGTTDYRIYAWYDNTDNLGKVKWWSNANKVYFPISSNSLFSNLTNVKKIILSGIDSSKTTNMSYMFGVCRNLTTLNLGDSFDTSNVGNIHQMFYTCSSLRTLDLGNKFDTSKVTDMKSVFYNCSSLTNLNIGSNFNTSRVNNMASMFQSCGLTTLNLGDKFYTSNVTSMQRMFAYSKLTTLDLSSFNTSKVTNMSEMFKGCSSLTRIYASDLWNTNAVTSSTDMFSGCSVLVGGEGTVFDSSKTNKTYAHIDGGENNKGYLTYKAAPENSGSTPEPTTPDSTTTPEITYVSTDSEHCIIEAIDENTWNYTFLGPDPDVQYYAWEDNLTGYTSSNPIEDHLTVVDGKGTITNTTTQSPPQFGSLSISQEVVSGFTGDTETSQLTSGDLNRTFLFTITLTDEDDDPLQGNEIYGDSVFTNGVTYVRLAHGDSVTISDIPAGYHYTVTEATTGGFQAQQSTLSGTIVAETTAEANFVNKKLVVETASLTLKKEVTGNFEDDTENFRFDVSFENLLAGEEYKLSNGETYIADDTNSANKTVYLQDNEQISFRDIPVGASYKITEAAGDYISSYEITDANSLNSIRTTKSANTEVNKPLSTSLESVDKAEVSGVEKIEDVTITFTNEKHKTADLAVKVLVTNAEENNTDSFALELVMKGLEPSMSYKTDFGPIKSDSDGEITTKINLSSDDEVVLYDLPVKSTYKIKELANEYKASYELVDANDLGKIETETASNTTTLTDLSTDEETVNEGENVTVILRNERVQKDLTVTKEVDMTYGNENQVDYENQEFEFEIEFTQLGANKEYTVEYSQAGVAQTETETFTTDATQAYTLTTTLKHGQSVTIKDLPTNATYQITEKAVKFYIASYTATGNADATIAGSYMANLRTNTALSTSLETVESDDADVHFTFTNTYAASDYVLPNTGLSNIKILLAFIMFGALLFATIYFIYSKKNKKYIK